MPRAARFLSWVPTLPNTTERTTRASVSADVFASYSTGLFSTFSIYQNLNQEEVKCSSTIHAPMPALIAATPEVQYCNTSIPALSQRAITELDRQFLRLYRQFRKKYNFQFPDTPCAYCSQLLLPRYIEWICFEAQEYYNLTEVLHLPVYQRTRRDRHQVAVYKLCRMEPGVPVNAGPWPSCLLTLPQRSRVFLLPLTLQTSLGRTYSYQAVHNLYTIYRTVTGRMNLTYNTRAIVLFSGTIGAYLESSRNGIDRGYDLVHLETCRVWLLAYNTLYARHDVMSELRIPPLLLADLFDEEDEAEGRLLNRPDIVLNPNMYNAATQDEDYRYFRLPVAIYQDNQQETIGLLRSDPATELLLFPVLYPNGCGQWSQPTAEVRIQGKGTRLQDVQQKLNSVISHFRDDHYWPGYIYIEVEAIRIFQNNQRIVSCRIRQSQDRRIPASDLLQQSIYRP
jgi:hypothetical protein